MLEAFWQHQGKENSTFRSSLMYLLKCKDVCGSIPAFLRFFRRVNLLTKVLKQPPVLMWWLSSLKVAMLLSSQDDESDQGKFCDSVYRNFCKLYFCISIPNKSPSKENVFSQLTNVQSLHNKNEPWFKIMDEYLFGDSQKPYPTSPN